MLVQNRSIFFNGIGLQSASAAYAPSRNQLGPQQANMLNKYVGEGNLSKGAAVPNGYRQPYSWFLPMNPKTGGLSSTIGDLSIWNGAVGRGTDSGFAAGGLNGVSMMTGSGQINSATMSLILYAIAALQGIGQISPNPLLSGKLEAAATLAGQGNFSGALGAISSAICAMQGSGTVSNASVLTADAYMTASITPFTTLSPQSLAAAVWNALAAEFEASGSMGQKLNAAGTAGDPWTAAVPGAYAVGTAGYTLGEYLDAKISSIAAGSGMTVAQFLALK